jgi:hypothetical protein
MGEAVNRHGMTSPVVTLEAEGQSLESRMLGNLHVRFGGGGEETQFGCAPYPYLTRTRASREAEPYCQEANVTDAAMVRLFVEPETPYNHRHTYDG